MTNSRPDVERVVTRARKLLALWRGSSGGEKEKSGNLLRRTLVEHDLTLADLELGLPAVTDLSALEQWRSVDGLLAQLGTENEGEALSQLVDVEGLARAERERVLSRLSLERLAASRAEGWLHAQHDEALHAEHLVQAARTLREEQVAAHSAPTIAASVRALTVLSARRLARPERRIRCRDAVHAAFVMALCEGMNALPARQGPHADEHHALVVRAHLSADELSRVRTLMHSHEQELRAELEQRARDFARSLLSIRRH